MPFTVAHAAAALPLRRLNLIWSAFIIGSFAPDFPYIIGSTKYRYLGHAFPGVVLFALPASFVALWLFHAAVKRPVVGLFPVGFQQRLRPYLGKFQFGGFTRFVAILFSIALGIALHLLWDAFTHPFTWPWRHSLFLRLWVTLPVVGWTPIFQVLQYGSTVVGLVAIAVWVLLWYRNTTQLARTAPSQPQSRFSLALLIFAAATAAGFLRAAVVVGMPTGFKGSDEFMLVFSVTSLALAFWMLLLYCLLATAGLTSTAS